MVTKEDQTTKHEYIIAMFRRIAQTADDCWVRSPVSQGDETTHLDRIASMLDFILICWLPDEEGVVVAILQWGQQLGRLDLGCFAGQAVAAPIAARSNRAKGVERPQSVLRKPPWVLIPHEETIEKRA